MSTSIEIQQAIRRRAHNYPQQAQEDIETLLAEIDRLGKALSDEYSQRVAAEATVADQLARISSLKAEILELRETLHCRTSQLTAAEQLIGRLHA